MDYFNKKISILGGGNQIISTNSTTNQNKTVDTTNNTTNTTSNTYSNDLSKQTNKSVDQLPDVKDDSNFSYKNIGANNFDYIPKFVDQTIKLPITKSSKDYKKVKDLVKTHMEYSSLELDFHKLGIAKDHMEAAIYYLRNME